MSSHSLEMNALSMHSKVEWVLLLLHVNKRPLRCNSLRVAVLIKLLNQASIDTSIAFAFGVVHHVEITTKQPMPRTDELKIMQLCKKCRFTPI
jgi:hypothetical protein